MAFANPVRHLVAFISNLRGVNEAASMHIPDECLAISLVVRALRLIPAAHNDASALCLSVVHAAHRRLVIVHGFLHAGAALAGVMPGSGNLPSFGLLIVIPVNEMNTRWTASQQTRKSQQLSALMRIRLISTVRRLCCWATDLGLSTFPTTCRESFGTASPVALRRLLRALNLVLTGAQSTEAGWQRRTVRRLSGTVWQGPAELLR